MNDTRIFNGCGEIDHKRFNLGDTRIQIPCPECGTIMSIPYLSYPRMGETHKHEFYCSECEKEFDGSYKLTVKLELSIKNEKTSCNP